VNPSPAGTAIGVDVGGTKIAVGLVGATGRQLIGTRPTVRADGTANAETVRELVSHAITALGRPASGIGISVTTTIDEAGGLRDASDWLGWRGWSADTVLGEVAGTTPAIIANDALCGAVAEQRHLAASGTMLYVTLGTGIAHTAVIDGRPLQGQHGGALFSGWSPAGFDDHGTPRATWEELAAGPALARRFDGSRDARPLVAAARQGEARARSILAEGSRWFGAYLTTIVQSYDPGLLVIGGGLAHGVPEYVTEAVSRMRELVRQDFFEDLVVVPAALGADSGWIGAGQLAAG
jgi:glucokinase